MVPKLKQTSLDQTGIVIFELSGSEKVIPLFSLNPHKEAIEIEGIMYNLNKDVKLAHLFLSNNILDYRVEDKIREFQKEKLNILPEDMMEELLSGFPFVEGTSPYFSPVWYA